MNELAESFFLEAVDEAIRYLKAKDSSKARVIARKLESNKLRFERRKPKASEK